MLTGQIKAVFVVVFAVIFGAVQLACACTDANAASKSMQSMAMSVVQDSEHLGHDNHNGNHPAQSNQQDRMPAHDHESDHDNHTQDCGHCNGFDAYAASNQSLVAAAPSPFFEKTILAKPIARLTTPVKMAPTALAGLRWLDPPTPTPVTLKIRLLA